ncbi:hypothetical protein [Nocardioides sp. P5_C9_2]
MSRRLVRAVLVAALLGSAVGLTPAVAAASLPVSHVDACRQSGLDGASSMALVAARTGRDRSGPYSSVLRSWLYAVPGTSHRCVVVRLDGATVPRRPGRTTTYSAGHEVVQAGAATVDTGEVIPMVEGASTSGGSGGGGRGVVLVADTFELSETDRVPEEEVAFLPPALAGLAGHEVTVTVDQIDILTTATAWTESRLARPLTAAQARSRRNAEVARAKKVLESRIVSARSTRDETLALAASSAGLAAAWLAFVAPLDFEGDVATARAAYAASKSLAREHADQGRRGIDVRQAYDHEITLAVPPPDLAVVVLG